MRHQFHLAARLGAWAIAIAGALALAACGSSGKEEPAKETKRAVEELSCPAFSMVGDTQDAVFFDGKGTTIDNLRYHVTLEAIEGQCEYLNRNARLKVLVKVDTTTLIGPAFGAGSTLEVPLFVAATAGERVVAKQVQTLSLEARTGIKKQWIQDVTFDLPGDVMGPELEILVGFQLTPAQLARNREYR